jgi:hypothetical protein
MRSLIMLVARGSGLIGLLLCLVSGFSRVAGSFWLGGMQTGTVLSAGTALMVLACLAYLAILVEKPWPNE